MAGAPEHCDQRETTSAYALGALPADELPAAERHIAACPECEPDLEQLHSLVARFAAWPTDVVRPPRSLRERLAARIAEDSGAEPLLPKRSAWLEPAWDKVAPGIECKLLATDEDRHRVSMLVRLEPGASYPPHTHAGIEELHLLDGELWIDERKLFPGDYNYGPPGASDDRVFSETGCTCILVTSTKDILR